MEGPKEIWDDIEEAREKIRTRRRQITGGDIEDEIVLKSMSVLHLMDEAFELAEDSIARTIRGLQEGLFETRDDQDDEVIEKELSELVSMMKEKRRLITGGKGKEKLEETWDDIEDRLEKMVRMLKD